MIKEIYRFLFCNTKYACKFHWVKYLSKSKLFTKILIATFYKQNSYYSCIFANIDSQDVKWLGEDFWGSDKMAQGHKLI